jgi:hypothetical protein
LNVKREVRFERDEKYLDIEEVSAMKSKSINDSKYLVCGMAILYGLIVFWMIVSDERREKIYRPKHQILAKHAPPTHVAFMDRTDDSPSDPARRKSMSARSSMQACNSSER